MISSSFEKIPVFRPCKLSTQGLTEQVAEFDELHFGIFKQELSSSYLQFTLQPKLLAEELKKVYYKLTLCLRPAYDL